MPANSGEETPDSLNEGLVTARFDGVVPEKSDAVLAVCDQVDAPPGHGSGGPVGAVNPSKCVVDCANLPSIIRGPESSYPIRVGAVRDDGSPERGGGVLRASDKDPHPADAGSKEAEPSVYRTMSGLDRGG